MHTHIFSSVITIILDNPKNFWYNLIKGKTKTKERKQYLDMSTNNKTYIPTDWSLEDPQERIEKVNEIIANTPPEKLTPYYLDKLATYIIKPNTIKERKQEKPILTNNRMITINEWETSFEGLVGKLENGEDGLYNMIADKDRLTAKNKMRPPISEEDRDTIPGLAELMDEITELESRLKETEDTKKQSGILNLLIDLRKKQYDLKKAFKPQGYSRHLTKSIAKLDLTEKIFVDMEGGVHSTGIINFFNEDHVSLLLCNYSGLKEETWSDFNGDVKWMMMDFDDLVSRALEPYPVYMDIVILKIDGKSNIEIQQALKEKYGILHSVEYISSLWRNKIPKLIVRKAEEEWLIWHFSVEEKGKWKKCSRCGQIKLAHNHFFSKNNTSKDGWYSICKECRNKKKSE